MNECPEVVLNRQDHTVDDGTRSPPIIVMPHILPSKPGEFTELYETTAHHVIRSR